jgi:ATP-dependent helicase Lhr and Lhr-like helicase
VLVGLQGLALPVEVWERDVLPRRTGAYSQSWLDSLCASGELVWVGAGPLGARSGRVALYFRDDAPAIGPPSWGSSARTGTALPDSPEHDLLRARLAQGPCFFTDLLAELEAPAESLRVALWDLVWAGEVTNDAWAPLRAPHLALARSGNSSADPRAVGRAAARRSMAGSSRFGVRRASARRSGVGGQVQGRWALTEPVFRGFSSDPSEQRRALCELLLERYGVVTREQVLAEGIRGGFAILYEAFSSLETLGVCRRGYFIEGMGGAQFALPGAVERLRAMRSPSGALTGEPRRTLVIAAADPAQPYGAALPWPKRDSAKRRPARVAGAYVVMVDDQPALYVERGGRGLVTLSDTPAHEALVALAEAVRTGRVGRLAFERIDGEPAIASAMAEALIELGFHSGPRRLTLTA